MKFPILLIISLLSISSEALSQSAEDSLYVFVGKKIEVIEFNPATDSNQVIMDHAFKAKYKIIQNVFGNYNKDTIEFEVYDHYGKPAFSEYQNVLLYVRNYKGKLYHSKYLFSDVYMTKNGQWAGAYSTEDYKYPDNINNQNIRPELIDFNQEISYGLGELTTEEVSEWFPSPYYRIENNRAIAVWGNYIEQLFELKKRSVLKARGYLFK